MLKENDTMKASVVGRAGDATGRREKLEVPNLRIASEGDGTVVVQSDFEVATNFCEACGKRQSNMKMKQYSQCRKVSCRSFLLLTGVWMFC